MCSRRTFRKQLDDVDMVRNLVRLCGVDSIRVGQRHRNSITFRCRFPQGEDLTGRTSKKVSAILNFVGIENIVCPGGWLAVRRNSLDRAGQAWLLLQGEGMDADDLLYSTGIRDVQPAEHPSDSSFDDPDQRMSLDRLMASWAIQTQMQERMV